MPPGTWSEQFSCARVTAFSLTSLFLEPFWRDLRISFRSHKPDIKTKTPKNGIFDLLMTFDFPFHFILIMRSWTERSFHFRGKKCCKMHLKRNQSLKTPWHMKVAHSGLWAPDAQGPHSHILMTGGSEGFFWVWHFGQKGFFWVYERRRDFFGSLSRR